jgi:hypothetical protein
MAKRKYVEEPVYPVAPLVITKDKFIGFLTAQIEKGKELLEIEVPLANPRNAYFEYVRRYSDKVDYEETAQNEFFAKFNRWHDRNKEIYRSSFAVANNVYFHEYELQLWNHIYIDDIIKIYKEDINRLMNQMQTDIERVDLMKCDVQEDTSVTVEPKKLSRDIFIVHGHNEEMKQTVARIVSRLGLNPIIIYSSFPTSLRA